MSVETGEPETETTGSLTAPLAAAIDELAGVDLDSLSDGELAGAMVGLRRLEARLAAQRTRLTAAFEARGVHLEDGSRSAGTWVAHRLNTPVGQGRVECLLARRLRVMPLTSEALAAGEISERHATRLARLAVGRTAELFARDEAMLVDDAKTLCWADFCRALDYWEQLADPDGPEDKAQHDHAARRVHLSEGLRGTGHLDGFLTPLGRTTVATALGRIEQELFEADWAAVRAEFGDDAVPAMISRTPAQRRHDAFVEMARRSMTAPADGKRPLPLVSVLVGYETFRGRVCELADGTVITPGTVASQLDEAVIERVVFDGPSRVIDIGRARSFVGAARRALEVRDRGCTHPSGCDAPLERCQGDHIQAYSDGGVTHPDNGRLDCGYHNRWRWAHGDPGPPDFERPPPLPPDADREQRAAWLEEWRRRLQAAIRAQEADDTW